MTGAPFLPPPLEVALRRVVERAVIVVLGAGLLASMLVARPVAPAVVSRAVAAAPSSTTSSSTAAASATSPTSRPAPRRAAVVETTLLPPTTTTTARPSWPDARPPTPGSYAYRATVDGVSGPATLDVADLGGQRRRERLSVGDSRQDRTLQWSPSAEALLGNTSCRYAPAPTELALPLVTGRSWQSSATCATADASMRLDETGTVTGTAVVLVAGQRTPVWVIRRSSTTTATSSAGTVVSETRTTDLFAPAMGLVVYQTGKAARPDEQGVVRTSEWILQLED